MKIKIIDTEGGHYGIILETQKKKTSNVLYLKDAHGNELGTLFLKDKKEELCSFNAVRKVHEVNRHKQKEQLITAYRNAG